jgi:mannosyl-3-phosphoglycerate synthase
VRTLTFHPDYDPDSYSFMLVCVKDANVNIDTMRFSHLLETDGLYDLNQFLTRTAFVIAHKNESLATLLAVIWYLPVTSPILIVTNCAEIEKEKLEQALTAQLAHHPYVYLIHQKDEAIARFFTEHNVCSILDPSGKVVNGKGEGMYIGALIATLLGDPEWIVFYDADNFVPSALLEYTLAMSRLFMRQHASSLALAGERRDLHNVRICWSSKPTFGTNSIPAGEMGRCTSVVSPLLTELISHWFGIQNCTIISSNAGEQGFTMEAARTLRFSSGYSVETFLFLDLLSHDLPVNNQPPSGRVILQQYQAQSPHFHEKGDDEHIKRMISDSLGSFYYFREQFSPRLRRQVQRTYREMGLEFRLPTVYPSLQELAVAKDEAFTNQYRLSAKRLVFAGQEDLCG